LLSHGPIFGPSSNDRDLEAEIVDDLAQELAATKEWFDERQPKVRPGQRQRYPGQARSTTDVGNPLAGTQQFLDRGTIQYVAVPQPVHFAGPKQPPFHTCARQNLGVPPSVIRPGSEEGLRCPWRRGHLYMFHVKHPPDLAGRNGQARTTSM
jgi:hypothetical protein